MQKWLDDNDVLIYSKCKVGKSVVAERFVRSLNGKTYKKRQLMIVKLILVIIVLLVKNLYMLIIMLCLKNLNRVMKLLNLKWVIVIKKIFLINSVMETNP